MTFTPQNCVQKCIPFLIFVTARGEGSLGIRLLRQWLTSRLTTEMTSSMHTHSLRSTILFHIWWELSLCCMRVNSSDWRTRRRVTLCKNVDTCHAWTQLWLPPSCVPVTTVLDRETPLLRAVLTELSVLSPSHFHLSWVTLLPLYIAWGKGCPHTI